jgi:hypothetical protein
MTNQNDQRLIQMRQVLLQTVTEKYQSFLDTIQKIPFQQDFKIEAIRNINQGYLWLKEGSHTINFNFEEPKPTEPLIEEVKEEIEEV